MPETFSLYTSALSFLSLQSADGFNRVQIGLRDASCRPCNDLLSRQHLSQLTKGLELGLQMFDECCTTRSFQLKGGPPV